MKNLKAFEQCRSEGAVKSFLHNTLQEIMSLVEGECGSLFLFDQEHKELVLNTFYNTVNLHLEGLRKRLGEGIAGKVADTKEPVLVKDISKDVRFQKNGFAHYRTNSFICIPLFTSKGIFGIINLADKRNGDSFTEKDFECATSIIKYACLAIDSFQDYTGLRQEKELLDKQKTLLEKYATVGKLAAGVVHEINNPLDGIIRYTNILLNQIDNNSVAQEYLLEAKKGLNRIANITKTLLEFSHQVNSVTPVKKYVDLRSVIDESLDILGDKINDGIRIHKRYKDLLPKVADLGIAHVVINIIKNAFDAMPSGGILEISADVHDTTLEINFKDTGMGISADVINSIFDPFFTTKSIEKGTGLGLAMCKEIINKYEGKIRVASAPGQGSTFTVSIPKKYFTHD